MHDVVIVGGGIAGLATLHYLIKGSRGSGSFVLLESRASMGGNILSEKCDGFLIEGGPDCFLASKYWTIQLAEELGISRDLLPTQPALSKTFVLSGGRLHPLPQGLFLMVPTSFIPLAASGLFSWPGKIRMGLELFVPRRKNGSDESLESFITRRLGREALETIAEPLIAGIHASVPERLSVRSAFPRFVEMEEKYGSLIRGMIQMKREALPPKAGYSYFMSFKEGQGELITSLVSSLPSGCLRGESKVTKVEQNKQNEGYVIHLEAKEPLLTKAVILATPSYVSAELLGPLNADLSARLKEIPYASTATVNFGYAAGSITHPLKGYGFIVPRKEKRKIMACTWTSSKFAHRAPPGSALLRVFLGDKHYPDWLTMNDEDIYAVVLEELRDIMGLDASPALKKLYRWEKSMPQYVVGHEERILDIDKVVESYPGLFLTGSAYKGIGIGDCIRNAELTAQKAALQGNLMVKS